MRDRLGVDAHIGEADDFPLAHGNAAENLRQIFAEGQPGELILDPPIMPSLAHADGVVAHLPERFGISRQPGQSMRGALFLIHPDGIDAAVDGDAPADGERGLRHECIDRSDGRACEIGETRNGSGRRRRSKCHFESPKLIVRIDCFSRALCCAANNVLVESV